MPTDPSVERTESYRWLVFGLLALAYLLVYFHRLSPAVVALDLMKDLKAGGALMGFLGSAYFYPYAFMQIPSGLLSDTWGPRRTITVSFILAGAASIFFGLAVNATWAIVARVLVGLGVSMLFVPTMKVLTHWFRRSEFAMMTSLMIALGGLGVLTAATPLAWMSNALGWRGSFIGIGIVTLVLSGAIWIFVRNTPEEKGLPPVEAPDYPSGAPGGQAIGLGQGVKMVLTRRSFWPLAVWFFFTCGIFFAFGGLWGGPYLMHVYGLTKSQAGNILTMLAVGMILGSPLLGYLSDKIFHSRKKILIGASMVVLVMSAGLAFIPDGFSIPALYLLCFLLSLCSSAIVSVGFTTAKELFPVAIAGTAVGLINFFPFLGGAVMQPVVGGVLESLGPPGGPYSAAVYGRGFTAFFVAAVIALIGAFLTEETYPVQADG